MPIHEIRGPLAAALLLTVATGATAQEARRDTVPVLLPGVTVTVLRTPIELTRVPYAVAVNGKAEIQRAKPGLGLDEALRGIPGVQVDNRYNYALGERISIRGFGARSQFGVRGVKVLVDGVPATFPDGQTALSHVDLAFLGRAEVIRGPASSLYGNTAGGVIQLETEDAPDRPLGQELGVTAGAHGLRKYHSTTGGRSGKLTYLLNVSQLDYGGFREHAAAENQHYDARLTYTGGRNDLRLVINVVDYDAQNPGSLSEPLLRENRLQAFRNNKLQQTGERGRQGQIGATWRRALGVGEWELSGYGISRSIDNPIPTSIVDLQRGVLGARALLRGRGPGVGLPLQWTVGAEADRQSDDRRNFRNQQGERGNLTLDQGEGVANLAAFAQISASPTARLTLLGGARFDWFRFAVEDRLVTAANPDDSGSRVLEAVSPSLGVSYVLGDPLTLYGNVATAFETPTTTELANRPSGAGGFNPELEPQRTLSFEAGGKGRLGARALYQLAVYHARVSNALIPFEVPQAAGRQFFRNAGSTLHRGVEAGVTLSPLAGVLARGAYTYTNARFDQYTRDGKDFAGNRLPGVAPHRVELTLSYRAPGGWFAAVEGRHASSIPVDDDNSAFSPAYWVADLRAGVEEVRVGRFGIEPFVGISNLADVEYNTSVVINAFGRRFFEPGPGRALYGGARLRL